MLNPGVHSIVRKLRNHWADGKGSDVGAEGTLFGGPYHKDPTIWGSFSETPPTYTSPGRFRRSFGRVRIGSSEAEESLELRLSQNPKSSARLMWDKRSAACEIFSNTALGLGCLYRKLAEF